MTLNQRLIVAFGASVLCTAMLGLVGLQQGSKLGGVVSDLTQHSIRSAFVIGRVNGLAKDLRGKMRSHVVESEMDAMRKLDGEIGDLREKLRQEIGVLDEHMLNDSVRVLFAQLAPRLSAFEGAWISARQASVEKRPDAMPRFLAEVMPKFKELQEGVDALESQLARDVDKAAEQSASSAQWARWVSIGLLLLAVAVCTGMGWWTIRYAHLGLTSSVDQLKTSAGLLSGMARELNAANEQISSGATEQVAAIQSTTDSGDRVRGMAERFAEQAGTVSETVTRLNTGMDVAKSTLEMMVVQMKAIEESSSKIQRLSGLVDSIAFQTHILSLNASIEAARSGEAGRGFEVVAGEVKSLARQSGEAAQETANLIAESLSAVGAGSKSLTQIVTMVSEVGQASSQIRGLVSEIEAASRQQAMNMTEISTSLREVEVVSSRTAAAAEQGFAQQREMEVQAEALLVVVQGLQSMVKQP